jgi:hypothetical protein
VDDVKYVKTRGHRKWHVMIGDEVDDDGLVYKLACRRTARSSGRDLLMNDPPERMRCSVCLVRLSDGQAFADWDDDENDDRDPYPEVEIDLANRLMGRDGPTLCANEAAWKYGFEPHRRTDIRRALDTQKAGLSPVDMRDWVDRENEFWRAFAEAEHEQSRWSRKMAE